MGIHAFSERVIDYAERLSDMADAAEGKGRRTTSGSPQWLLLPAAGAGLYALVRSDFFTKQAKGVADEAKTRASELPTDLMKAVRHASQKSSTRPPSTTPRQRSSARSSTTNATRRRRNTTAARKTTAARRRTTRG